MLGGFHKIKDQFLLNMFHLEPTPLSLNKKKYWIEGRVYMHQLLLQKHDRSDPKKQSILIIDELPVFDSIAKPFDILIYILI